LDEIVEEEGERKRMFFSEEKKNLFYFVEKKKISFLVKKRACRVAVLLKENFSSKNF
jgi:hypothetical protein